MVEGIQFDKPAWTILGGMPACSLLGLCLHPCVPHPCVPHLTHSSIVLQPQHIADDQDILLPSLPIVRPDSSQSVAKAKCPVVRQRLPLPFQRSPQRCRPHHHQQPHRLSEQHRPVPSGEVYDLLNCARHSVLHMSFPTFHFCHGWCESAVSSYGHWSTCPLVFRVIMQPAACHMCCLRSRTLDVSSSAFKQLLPDQQQAESEPAPQYSSGNHGFPEVSGDPTTASSLLSAAPFDADRCLSGSILNSLT